MQSRIGNCYTQARKFLKENRQVLFSGTPCQIAGLKRFLQKEYDNLITVDFICHGVPSPMVFRRYLDEKICALAHSAARNTVFHSETLDKNIFMRGFLRDIYLRPSCYACPTKSGKSGSDITIADYWGIQNIHPEMDDDKGTSLVVINIPKGVTHYTNIQVAQVLLKTNAELAFKNNPSINHSVNMPSNRPTFYKQLASANVNTLIKRYTKLSYKSRFKSICILLITKVGVKEQLKKMIR
ncbi:MAG: Coenzyme F420 hydrogenase/dehydrogenase, beta subunit C-terminal domain [Marinifilaceae bacterium]